MLSRKEILTVCLFGALVIAGVLLSVAVYKKSIDYLPIREHPDLVLRRVAEPISQVDGSIISLAEDIVATLQYITLVDFFLERSIPRGLAAPQVGISKRLVVCGINGRIKVMVNPEILERRGTYIDRDGEVLDAQVVDSLGYGCDESARLAIFYHRFTPGMIKGQRVKVQMEIPIEFKLPKDE